MNKHPAKVVKKFRECKLGDIGISTITISELQYGVSKSTHRERNQQRLNEFIVPFEILNYDATAARVYGDTRFQLEKSGKSIVSLDLLIGAHAMSQNLILVTNNVKEFKRIKKLKVENWTK